MWHEIRHTVVVALTLCLVCSILVSSAAVGLRPWQEENKKLERRKNILLAAGLLKTKDVNAKTVEKKFEQVETRLVNLQTGEYADESAVNLDDYDQRKAARTPEMSVRIPPEIDFAGIRRREKYSFVYLINDDAGRLQQIVLPVYGKGLWSTMYGFLALGPDARTVKGITFYEHGETPGLGGEIDNPKWQAQWPGKQVFEDGEVAIEVVGEAPQEHKIDALAGATITSQGVEGLIRYWLGDHAFGPFLERIRQTGGTHG